MMRVLIDTSVLVAAMVNSHPAHVRALPWLQRIRSSDLTGIVAAHSVAETYAVLTRLPVQPRITPHLAHQVIQHNIIQVCTIIALTPDDYGRIVADLAEAGLVGDVIYDALAVYTAKQASVDHILTLNAKDFRRIYPELQDKIVEP